MMDVDETCNLYKVILLQNFPSELEKNDTTDVALKTFNENLIYISYESEADLACIIEVESESKIHIKSIQKNNLGLSEDNFLESLTYLKLSNLKIIPYEDYLDVKSYSFNS